MLDTLLTIELQVYKNSNYGYHELMVAINLGDQTKRYKYWDRY